MITSRALARIRPIYVSGTDVAPNNTKVALLFEGNESYEATGPCAPVIVGAQCAGWALAILLQRCGWRFTPQAVRAGTSPLPAVRYIYPEWKVGRDGRRRIKSVLAECWNGLVVDVLDNACPDSSSGRAHTALLDLFETCFTSRISDEFFAASRTLMARRAYLLDTHATTFIDWGIGPGTSHPILNGLGAPIATILLGGAFPDYYPFFYTSAARENSDYQLVELSHNSASPDNQMHTEEVTAFHLVGGLQAVLARSLPPVDRYSHNALKNACMRVGGQTGFYVDSTLPKPDSDVLSQLGPDLASKSMGAVAWMYSRYQDTGHGGSSRPVEGHYPEVITPPSYPFGVACSYIGILGDDQNAQITQATLDVAELLRDRMGVPPDYMPTATLFQMVEQIRNNTSLTLSRIGEPAESSSLVAMITALGQDVNSLGQQITALDPSAAVDAINAITIRAAQALTVAIAEAIMPPDRWLKPGRRQAVLAKSLRLNYPEIFDASYTIFPDKEVRDDEPA